MGTPPGVPGRGDAAGGRVGRVAGGAAAGRRRRAAPHRGGPHRGRAARRHQGAPLQEGPADYGGSCWLYICYITRQMDTRGERSGRLVFSEARG